MQSHLYLVLACTFTLTNSCAMLLYIYQSYAIRAKYRNFVKLPSFLNLHSRLLNNLIFSPYTGDGLKNFQAEILLFPLHPPQFPPTKNKPKKAKIYLNKSKAPLSVPITPSLGEEAFLGGWTRVGGGETGSGSRRLQSAARFKSKGGERVKSNKHQPNV